MAISGLSIVGRPFALWPATLQVMPGGVLDAGFQRFFVGITVANASSQAWAATELRITQRGRKILGAAGIVISDGWGSADAAATGQTAQGEWIPLPAVPAGGQRLVLLKLDVSKAAVGAHTLELELREPTIPQTTILVATPLFVARTSFSASQRTFSSECDRGTLVASINAARVDQESFRSLLRRARAMSGTPAPGIRTPAETERLRKRLKAVLCGDEPDVCGVLADLTTSCALPTPPLPGPAPSTGLASLSIFSTHGTTLGDRTRISDGSVGSNLTVNIGNDGLLNVNVLAGGNVQIGDRTRIQGDVTTAGTTTRSPSGGSVVLGLVHEHASYTSQTIPTKTVTPGSTAVTVANGVTQTIAPGSYGIVTLRANSKVTFSTGTYRVTQLVIEPDVTLTLDQPTGPIDVQVRDSLSFGDRVIIKSGAVTAPDALAQFYSDQTTEVRVGTDIALLPVALSAPKGSIHVYSRTNVVGSLLGKTVILEPDVGIGRVPADVWLGTGGSGLEFLGYPTNVAYSVNYRRGYYGSLGPLAFDAVPWKALLANAALLFELSLPSSIVSELLALAARAVIGTVKSSTLNAATTAPGSSPPPTQAGSVDAAAVNVTATRALGFPLYGQLDAAPGEANSTPISASGGIFGTSGGYLSNSELSAIIANAASDPAGLKVHKSGAGSGVTHGVISALVPTFARPDDTGTLYFANQLVIVPDAQAPAANGVIASAGDSGSLWIQTRSNKLVGLSHAIGATGAVISRIEDVVNALQIQFG